MAVEFVVCQSRSHWTVGVTDDPARRKGEHEQEGEDTSCWHQWDASTEETARQIEKHFLDKGCKGGTGGGSANWVYIF
jgi:predicted GIY-YIG superfamily endonuclease